MEGFKPYEGGEPYIFISYAHADSPAVMEILNSMHDRGYRIWYDEGIEVGSEWPECIASHLAGAGLVVAFISKAYMRSDNCRREMHYALSKRIKIINVFLESAEMSPGMEMQIGSIFALMKYGMSGEQFYQRLYSAPLLSSETFAAPGQGGEAGARTQPLPEKTKKAPVAAEKKGKRKKLRLIAWLSVLTLLLAAVITLGIVGHFTGLTQRIFIQMQLEPVEQLPGDTVAQFENGLFERAAREFTGISQGELRVSDLAGLTSLYIIGDEYWFESPPEELRASQALGEIDSLGDLAYFTGLDVLWLCGQPLSSLESLPGSNIEYLDLSGCKLSSLQGLGSLIGLRELVTDGCPISALGDIDRCLQLRRISLLSSRISDFSALKPLTKLADFSVSNCALDELGTVLGISSLTNVSFYDCDLRGSFFKAFDRERSIVSLSLMDCQLNSTDNLNDFTGLTTLYISGSGQELSWLELTELPALSRVYIGEEMQGAIEPVLEYTGVSVLYI